MLQAQIYIDQDDLKDTQPLYEFILHFLLNHKIQGATMFRGRLGYGERQQVNRPDDLFSFDEIPLMITFVDEDEKVNETLKALRKEWQGGLIVTHAVNKWA